MKLATPEGRETVRNAPLSAVPKWPLLFDALDLLDHRDAEIARLEAELAEARHAGLSVDCRRAAS